jgi:hypothetical protein
MQPRFKTQTQLGLEIINTKPTCLGFSEDLLNYVVFVEQHLGKREEIIDRAVSF